MTSYLVLASPGVREPDERSVVIADRFAFLGFIAPVIWLLFNRLWLEAFAAALVTVAASMLAGSAGQPALGLAIGLALQVITGLEGRNWRAASLQRRGWRLVDVVETDDSDTAFEIHAARAVRHDTSPVPASPRPSRPPLMPGRPRTGVAGSIGMVPVERK
ncbi:DUF2628 domain-containing protein [Hoeflea sp.]|uniref:DUF2628 domain-containing protein n=1 Tax=Hoeflea sp. TaxID=1940281 RepID=UPI00199D9346|nr:DUF2628 domain-containing protein [Hoeflea sp.]MBC7280288.1 DUF2628 domain-containing protein [Hoeflea sp.]